MKVEVRTVSFGVSLVVDGRGICGAATGSTDEKVYRAMAAALNAKPAASEWNFDLAAMPEGEDLFFLHRSPTGKPHPGFGIWHNGPALWEYVGHFNRMICKEDAILSCIIAWARINLPGTEEKG